MNVWMCLNGHVDNITAHETEAVKAPVKTPHIDSHYVLHSHLRTPLSHHSKMVERTTGAAERRRRRRGSTYKISPVPVPKCKTTLHIAARGSVCGSVSAPGPPHWLLFSCEAITTQLPSPTLRLDRRYPAIQRNQPAVLWVIAGSNRHVVYLCVRGLVGGSSSTTEHERRSSEALQDTHCQTDHFIVSVMT